MKTITYKLKDLEEKKEKKVTLKLGYVGENEHVQIRIDCAEIWKDYPAAVASLAVEPPEGSKYPAIVTRDGDVVCWTVKDSDLVHDGYGRIQLTFTEGSEIQKTVICRTKVDESIVGSGTAPDPIADFVSEANEALAELEAAEVHGPVIGEDGYWYTWSKDAGEYVKTDTKAQGEDGQQGPAGKDGKDGKDGADGAPGQDGHTPVKGTDYWTQQDQADIVAAAALETVSAVIDDTAGDGDTNKTWSADKIAETTGQLLTAIQGIEDELNGQQTIDTKSVNPDSEWSNGGVQAAVGDPIAFSTSSSYRYAYYDISESDISFTVTTHQSTSTNYPKYVHFVNAQGVVLSAVGNVESTAGDYTYSDIPIPEGAVKMYVTFNGTNPAISPTYSVTKKYYSENVPGISEKVDEAVSDVQALKENVGEPENVIKSVKNKNIVNGGLKGETGGILTTTVTSSYYNVTVNVEDDANKYIIRMKQSTSSNYPHYFWFVNANGTILLAGGEIKESDGYYTYTVDSIPAGAKTLSVLTGGGADNIIIKKEVTISIRSEMDDIEHYFDKKGLSTSPYADELKDEGRATVFGYNFSRKCLNFAFITDTHFGGTRYPEYDARNNMRAFADMANERWLDFAAHGGDIITDYGLSRNEAIEWMDDTLGIFGDIQIPVLIAKGNHEANSAYYQLVTDTSNLDWDNNTYYVRDGISFAEITEEQWNGADDLYIADATPERIPDIQFTMLGQLGFAGDVVRNSSDYLGGYFYKDFDYNKIRVIVLDEYQIRGTTWIGMSSDQLAWLGSTALVLGDKADYSVMIISHSPNVSADVVGLINAYKNGTSYTISGQTYDFTSQGAKPFIMYLHGHEHNDTLVTTDGFNNIGVTCGFVPAEKVETEEEIRFSIFTVDTTERKIYETRIGYGSSREFTY